jgi:glycosyltransferase involved in cell wall biosynthesis
MGSVGHGSGTFRPNGSPRVIYRAVSHARAVIASDLPDFRGLAQDEDLQLTWFAPGDSRGLARALEGVLSDADRRRRLVRHNLRAIERLKPAKIVDAYLAAFNLVPALSPRGAA